MIRRFCVLALLAVFMAIPLGCCSNAAAVKALKDGQAVNKGHMNDEALPKQARLIAQDNYDLMSKVLFNLDGTPLPEEVKGRMPKGGDK